MKSRMNCYLGLISIVVFSLVLVSSDGMVFGQKSFFDECSNNCTNNGVCKDGNCVCNAGFELPDCSFQCGSVGQFCCIGSSCSSGLVCFKSQQNPTGLCTNYGGHYEHATINKQDTCLDGNEMNGFGCSCGAGFKESCHTIDRPDVATAELCICSVSGGSDDCAYQGSYSKDSKCLVPNPFTGDCSCASSTTEVGPFSLGASQSSFYWCASKNPSSQDSFGGLFQEDAKGSCLVGNPLSNGGCGCDGASDFCGSWEPTKSSYIGFCSATKDPKGSVQLSISPTGFTKTLQKAIELALPNLKLNLPDQSGHDWSVHQVEFDSLKFPDVTITISDKNQMTISFTGGSLDGSIGRIDVKKGFISTHCDAHPFDLNQISASVNIGFYFGVSQGIPQVYFNVKGGSGSVGNIDIDVHGNLICDAFKGTIENAVKSAVTSGFNNMLLEGFASVLSSEESYLNAQFAATETAIPVGEYGLVLDASLSGCVIEVSTDPSASMIFAFKGSFFSTNLPVEDVHVSSPFPVEPSSNDRDSQLCISSRITDSLAWNLFQSNSLYAVITNSEIPPNSPVHLNTSDPFISQIAPNLTSNFPSNEMVLEISCSSSVPYAMSPQFIVNSSSVTVVSSANVLFWVVSSSPKGDKCKQVNGGGYWCFGFSISQEAIASGIVKATDESDGLKFEVSVLDVSLNASLVQSEVGMIQMDVYNQLSSLAVPNVLQYLQDFFGNTTFTVPTTFHNVALSNFSPLTYYPGDIGYVCLYADMTYL